MRIKIFFLLLLICFPLAIGSTVMAAENQLGLDDSIHYDIYIAGYGDVLTVLKDVDIVAVKQFYNETFVLVRTDTFNAKRSEGLISFTSIRAILPANRGSLQILQPESTVTKMKYFTPQSP